MMRRLSTNVNRKVSRVWIGVLGLLVLSFISQFVISNVLAIRGEEVIRSSDKINKLSQQNQQLREELAREMSITQISINAEVLGLSEASNVRYFDLVQPVAILPQ